MKQSVMMLGLALLTFALPMYGLAGENLLDSTVAKTPCSISIQSTPESAYVLFDGRLVGVTPLSLDSISPGTHHLQLQHHDLENWLAQPTSDTLELPDDDHRALVYDLRSQSVISSSPFGAEVVLGDSVLGTTPFFLPYTLTQQPLFIRKQGYEPSPVRLAEGRASSIQLKRAWHNGDNVDSYFKEPNATQKTVELYLSGTATVLGGVAAAYFKIKADNKYQQYLLSGDPNLLSQTHRLDTSAGVAIVVTQIGLGLFTYFILSQ